MTIKEIISEAEEKIEEVLGEKVFLTLDEDLSARLQYLVCAEFKTKWTNLLRIRAFREEADARKAYCYIAHVSLGFSIRRISRDIPFSEETGPKYCIKAAKDLIESGHSVGEKIIKIKKQIDDFKAKIETN